MDFLTQHTVLSEWLLHYGSFALFGLLALGIIALPIPNETLIVLAGILMFNGSLNIPSTLVASFAGSIVGITISYVIGRTFGKCMIRHFGGWLGLTADKIRRTNNWFRHFGKWTLFFGNFIPGIRHLTGIVAGSITLEYEYFVLFAYSGVVLWVSIFLSIGYFFGNYWISMLDWAEIYIDYIVAVAFLVFAVYLLFRVASRK